jgi:hypothetical protein
LQALLTTYNGFCTIYSALLFKVAVSIQMNKKRKKNVMNNEKDQEENDYIFRTPWSDLNSEPPENEVGLLVTK